MIRRCASLVALFAGLCLVVPASAQSAADKATARTLATAGIEDYEAGKFAEALDKVSRAQELFDAPIHLLYIARAQEKLGRLVESAETYRKLERVKLDAGAPAAFVKAQADGQRELTALLPRLPSLRILLEPSGVDGLKLELDGVQLSSAVIGVDRPSNPGERVIRVTAPGYATVERTVELVERQKLDVSIELERDGSPLAPPDGPTSSEPGAAKQPATEQAPGSKPSAAQPADRGFYVGLHLGGAVPIGDIGKHPEDGTSIPISDQFQPGGGGELRGGYRFARFFTPFLLLEAYGFKTGTLFNDVVDTVETSVKTTAYATGAGIGAMIGTPPGDFGFYGEVGLLLHQMTADMTVSQDEECSNKVNYSGTGFRLGGGMQIPIISQIQIEPFMTFTLSRFDTVTAERDERCDVPSVIGGYTLAPDKTYTDEDIKSIEDGLPGFGSRLVNDDRYDLQDDEKALHILLVVGVGVSFAQF
ncbi:MAG: PEGA domain-containing protein [Polyangiaceae bacterium]